MSKKRVLITGGAGFIGSHLAARLVKEGKEVVVLDNLLRGNKIPAGVQKKLKFIKGDVRRKQDVRLAAKGCDLIYHFAAVLGVDVVADNPVETMETEIVGLRNITDYCIANGTKKLIYSSTSGVYGHSAIEKSFTETISLDPRTSYAIAKRYNEIYLKALYEEKGLESVSLRFFNVYGPGQDTRMVVPRFMEQALKGEPLSVYGNGKQTRDFTYIDDTVTACIKVAGKLKGCEVLNVSNEEEISIRELAHAVLKITGSTSGISFIKAPSKRYDYEVGRRVGNSEKLYKNIRFKPDTSLEDGLRRMLKAEYGR
ncbi:MAG: SDR family NAD(P)-dependent oxidoreductase [Bacteroidia bacterium]|nr:SDR family NAD(P)-dependent oxidoreductase [Bacteroidia bacterium]